MAELKNKKPLKFVLVLLLLLVIGVAWHFHLTNFLTLDFLKTKQQEFAENFAQNRATASLIFLAVYIATTALSLPGATILTLAGGAVFGLWYGTFLVSIASTLGATCAFLSSRFILRDFFQKKFASSFERINSGIKKEGAFYLFSLRLIPIFPFFLVNVSMGLTALPASTYMWVSQLGMLPGTLAYVNAGTELSKIQSLKGIVSPSIVLSFIWTGLTPLIAKRIMNAIRNRKTLGSFKKPAKFDYNLVVIGAGAAGLVSSYIAAAVKAKVAIIEKNKMGGECLNVGCVPSKALIRSSKLAHEIASAHEYGITDAKGSVDFAQVMERVQKVIREIAPHDSVERYSHLGVKCILGEAKFTTPYTVQITSPEGNREISSKNFIIATGSAPVIPQIKGVELVEALNSDTVWDLRVLPKRLLVLGGGSIGCELSQAFQRLGSKVTLVEKSSHLISREDVESSLAVETSFRDDGIEVLTSSEAIEFFNQSGKKRLRVKTGDTLRDIEFDQVLVSLGRKARVEGFGLEQIGVKLTDGGKLELSPYLETNFSHIFACGDVAGPYQLTHVAAHQAWYAAVNALFRPFKKFKVDYRVIPWTTFTDPEVSHVGLSEAEAKNKKLDYEITQYDLDDLDRAIADGQKRGFVRVITPRNKDEILGVSIVGERSAELMAEFVLAMKFKMGLNKILGTVHSYPTFSEANKYLAGKWKRNHAPHGILSWVEKFHTFRRG